MRRSARGWRTGCRGGRRSGSRRCSCGRGRSAPGYPARHRDEPGLVVRMVLDGLDQDLQSVEAGGQTGGDGGRRPVGQGGVALAEEAGGVGRRVGRDGHGVGERPVEEPTALGRGHRDRGDTFDVGQSGPGRGHEVQVDVEHHLTLDAQVEIEHQAVDDVPDGALDGVLQGDESQVHGPGAHGLQDLDQRGERCDLGTGVGGLGQERLLGEGPFRAEEPDPHAGHARGLRRCVVGHGQAG